MPISLVAPRAEPMRRSSSALLERFAFRIRIVQLDSDAIGIGDEDLMLALLRNGAASCTDAERLKARQHLLETGGGEGDMVDRSGTVAGVSRFVPQIVLLRLIGTGVRKMDAGCVAEVNPITRKRKGWTFANLHTQNIDVEVLGRFQVFSEDEVMVETRERHW